MISNVSSSAASKSVSRKILGKLKESFALLSCLVVALQPMMVELASAQDIIIDPSGNVGFQPSLQRSSRPQVVDIVTPNSGGVSHNKYTKFDVSSTGTVLNNSSSATNSQLAGTISGNPNLSGGTASVILNEVTSTASSSLVGSIEVAGDSAGVIIANPNGILCNGCNFINATSGTLTTGVPVVDGEDVKLFVRKGTVTIGRNGLRGEAGFRGAVPNINLIGRTVVVDGKVTAIDGINVQGGAQRYHLTDQRREATLSGSDATPDFVIDGTEYGAMEAGRIQIIGNEVGVGVRTLGALKSNVDGVRVVNDGAVIVRSVSARGQAEVRASAGDLTIERDISSAEADTVVYAHHDLHTTDRTGLYGLTGVSITAQNRSLTFSGVVQSGADVSLFGHDKLTFSAYGSASGNFTIQGLSGVVVDDATIVANRVNADQGGTSFHLSNAAIFSSEAFNISTGDFYLGEDVVVAGLGEDDSSNLVVTASGDFHNSADMRLHNAAEITYSGNLFNEQGGVIEAENLLIAFNREIHNSGILYGSTSLDFDVAALFNNETGVILSDRLAISTTGLLQNAGTISSDGRIDLNSDLEVVNDGYIQGVRAFLVAPKVTNGGGAELRVRDDGRVTANRTFTNLGVLASLGDFQINVGTVENSGLVSVEANLSVIADTISNQETLTAGNSMNLEATGTLTNLGTIASYFNATLSSGGLIENQGMILVDNILGVVGSAFDNKGNDALVRAKTGNINTARLRNSGNVFLISSFRRDGNIDLFENEGVFASQGNIEITGRNADSKAILHDGSALISGLRPDDETQELLSGASVSMSFSDFTVDGRIASGGSVRLSGPRNLYMNGILAAGQDVHLTADIITVSDSGVVQAEGQGTITATERFTNKGAIGLGGYLRLGSGLASFTNNNYISVGGTDRFTVSGSFENTGVFQSSSYLDITAQNLINRGHLQSAGNTLLAAQRTTVNGDGETVTIKGSLTNNGTISVGASATFTGNAVRFGADSYLSAEKLRLTADSFHLRGSNALTGADRNDWTIAGEYRQYGTLFSEGALNISAGSFQSYADSLLGSSDYLALTVANSANLEGSLVADRTSVAALSIVGTETSSVFGSGEVRLQAVTGAVKHFGEITAGEGLYVTSKEFDLRGNIFGAQVHLKGDTQGTTRGNLYGGETIDIDLKEGVYHNYGLLEARDALTVEATGLNNYAGAKLASTEIRASVSGGISNAGTLFGASKIALTSGSHIGNQATGTITAVSLGLKAADFTNSGVLDLYGFFGEVTNNTRNFGSIETETYLGLKTGALYNRAGASLVSGDHLYIKSSGQVENYATARLEANSIDLRAGTVSNSGAIRASEVVNIADLTGALTNTASGTIYGATIAAITGTAFNNDGKVGQRDNTRLPVTEVLDISVGTSLRNSGEMVAENLRILAQADILNSGSLKADDGLLGVSSKRGSVTNSGTMRAKDIVVEAGNAFDNRSLFKASETISVTAVGNIINQNVNDSVADIGAKMIVLHAGGDVANSGGKLYGYLSLGVQSDGGDIDNSGQITGPDITMIAQGGSVHSDTGIYTSGKLAIEARGIALDGRVSVRDEVSLKSSDYDIEVGERIETKRLLVDAARNIKSNGGAFLGSELTQLVANDILRLDGNLLGSSATRKLGIISGAEKDIYVQLREGDIGALGPSVNATTGHRYEAVNWDVSGSVSLIADAGSILLDGTLQAGKDLYIRAGGSAILGSGRFEAADLLHIEGDRFLKNYGEAVVTAGQKVQLVQNAGWFYTNEWFSGDLTHSLSVQAKTIIVNSSHRLIGGDIYLLASEDIRQKDQVISARQITYSAGRDLLVRFNPFTWRENNPGAVNTGVWWDVESSGLRGHNLLSQGQGTMLYAGQDIKLQSGKIRSSGDLTIVAGRTVVSEPVYLETGRTSRPGDVGWSFSSKYEGVLAGHEADKVTLRELRAYENQISAGNDLEIIAGSSANFIGSDITASSGDISIEALSGGINMVAAPGYWSYNYSKTTTKKKFFGFYKKTTTYEYDAAEDIYKRASLTASNGDITLRATGENGDFASILSAGTAFTAQNIRLSTPNGNISSGTYAERSIAREESQSSSKTFWFIPFGSEDTEELNSVLVNYGSDFLADEILDMAAPSGTLSITGGSIRAQTLNLTAARLEINAAIDSAQQTYYSRRDNMITITTIQSGFDRETAHLPEITAENINFDISGDAHIQGYRGATLNSQLLNLIGTRTFDDATLGLASTTDRASAEVVADQINQKYLRSYDLPGASDGAQFAYLDTLIHDYGATYHTIELRDREWYDKQVQLNPAFKAMLQVVATSVTGGLDLGIGNAFLSAGIDAATANLVVGVVEGSITGDLDMDDILRGTLLAGASATISSYLGDQIDWGAGMSDQSPFLNDIRGNFAPSVIVDRLGDQVVNQVVTNVVYGQEPFDGFDEFGRTFLVSETLALAQFGIAEIGRGNADWAGSVGHLVLHGGIGCLAIEAMDGNCATGFFAGAGASLLEGTNLTDEQKVQLAPVIGGLVGFVLSEGEAVNVSFGSTLALSAVQNNYLSVDELLEFRNALGTCAGLADTAYATCAKAVYADGGFADKYEKNRGELEACLAAGDADCVAYHTNRVLEARALARELSQELKNVSMTSLAYVNDYAPILLYHYYNTSLDNAVAIREEYCGGLNENSCATVIRRVSQHRAEMQRLKELGFVVDFVPILGDIKAVYECGTSLSILTCAGAVIGVFPIFGDAASVAVRKGDTLYEVAIRSADDGKPVLEAIATNRTLNPTEVSFSQATVSSRTSDGLTINELADSMRQNGWRGEPLNVIYRDGAPTSMDNRRLLAARYAGIDVPVTIRNADDLLTPAQAENFSVGDITPSTWGEAMDLRIGRQGEMSGAPSDWAERFPNGSIYDPHIVE